jgi:thymidylate kinase
MRIVPVNVWNHPSSADNGGSLLARLPDLLPEMFQDRSIQIRRRRDMDSNFLDKIVSDFRVLIVEGISGSGKDTFQKYLKKTLKGRVVYDYSEGEVLHSWKQLQIEGILKLRVKFMKLFVNYVRDVANRDANAVFLLNRFHLSTYASTITQQPHLEREYNEIIDVLRTLPVHVFILQLDENEIEKRSLHPERSAAWQKFQEQIVGKHSFRDRLERQQRLILEAAKKQNIPYSVIKLLHEREIGDSQVRISKASSIVGRNARMNAADAKTSRRKRYFPTTL